VTRAIRLALLAAVPAAPALHYLLGVAPIWIFVTGIVGVGVLADRIREATEQLAKHTGPAVGGLLTHQPRQSRGTAARLVRAGAGRAGGCACADHRVVIVNAITTDGETTWFEGVLLIGVYLLLGVAFFFT
jgi:Ca2+/H+ antiporter